MCAVHVAPSAHPRVRSPDLLAPNKAPVSSFGERIIRPVSTLPPGIPAPSCQDTTGAGAGLGHRSISLNTLQQSIVFQPRMAQLETLEAKMASIEVSLSNSPRRKKTPTTPTPNNNLNNLNNLNSSIRSIPKDLAMRELDTLRNALRDKENIIQSLKGQLTIPGLRLHHQNLRGGGGNGGGSNGRLGVELSEVERKQAEERLGRLRNDTDAKRLAIKNLKMALERLDITDNIDVRIQQAELEYQLGREELNLLTLLEETRTLQHLLEECNKKISEAHTLHSCLSSADQVSIHAVEITFDPKSPRFGAGQKDSNPGLYVDWALEDSGLVKGDRFIEVNGKIVLTKSRDDLARLLSAAPDPALIVVLRNDRTGSCAVASSGKHQREVAKLRSELDVVRDRAEESQRTKDGLRTDNIRLTHRISYLEEQVSELISRLKHSESSPTPGDIRVVTQSPVITSTVKTSQNVTNINISSQPASIISNCTNGSTNGGNSSSGNEQTQQKVVQQAVQYQKGSQVSTLVASHPGLDSSRETLTSLPIRSRSSLSNVSNTHIGGAACTNSPSSKAHSKHRSSRGLQMSASSHDLDQRSHSANKSHHHHHHHHNHNNHRGEKDYNSETNFALDGYRDHQHASRLRKQIVENGHSRDYYNFGSSNYKQDGILTTGIQHSKSSPLLASTLLDSGNLMDQSYRKATRIVQDLTRNNGIREPREHHQHQQQPKEYRDYNSGHLYEKQHHKGGSRGCLTASEKYANAGLDVMKQQGRKEGRKSTSVLDFRSEIRIGPKYADSKSVEDLDSVDAPTPTPSQLSNNSTSNSKRLYRKLHDARSVKSLDFDSDNSSYYNHHHQGKAGLANGNLPMQSRMKTSADYASEAIGNPGNPLRNGERIGSNGLMDMVGNRPRPTPPKKPLRLSLHRAQSLQSVESAPPSTGSGGSPKQQQHQHHQMDKLDKLDKSDKSDKLDANGRKPMKRNHKGEGQVLSATEQAEKYENGLMSKDNGTSNDYDVVSRENLSNLKWTTFNQSRSRENIIYANENGHWC